MFVTKLHHEGVSGSSIQSKLSAISYSHKIRDDPDPTTHFLVSKVMMGIRKVAPSLDTRLPITFNILSSIVQSIPSVGWSHFWSVLFRAMITLSFHAFLRPGEITHSPNNLMFSDVTINQDLLSITFRKFKHHVGDPVTIEIPAGDPVTCPIKNLRAYLHLRGPRPGPLFCDSGLSPISYTHYNNFVGSVRAYLQLPRTITPHSARIGAATHAAAKGVPEVLIKQMGRWRSNAFAKYIRISTISTSSLGKL